MNLQPQQQHLPRPQPRPRPPQDPIYRSGVQGGVLLTILLLIAGNSGADVFEVDRSDDPFPAQNCLAGVPMDCSLREAVINANETPGPDLIVVPAGTYYLTRMGSDEDASSTGDLDVTDVVRIEGAGELSTIIEGGGAGGLGDRILDIHSSEAEIADLTLRGGSGVSRGAGFYNHNALLKVERCTIASNRATGVGGGIQDEGVSTYIEATIRGNEGIAGGGIGARGAIVFLDSLITDNHATASSSFSLGGGGVLSYNTLTRFVRTVISYNTSGIRGGGIHAEDPVEIIDSMILSNSAPDSGGGLFVDVNASTTITGSSFAGNMAGFVGGAVDVAPGGMADVTNSTFSGNTAGTAAGGLHIAGTASLTNVTISRNTSAVATAVMNTASSGLTYADSILEGSCNAAPTVTSLGGNIESPGAGCQLNASIDQIGVSSADLNLGPIGFFGGPTLTQVPLAGSSAVDMAAGCPASLVDQRGFSRPIDGDGIGGATCDVGAVEALLNEYPWLFRDGFESGDTSGWQ